LEKERDLKESKVFIFHSNGKMTAPIVCDKSCIGSVMPRKDMKISTKKIQSKMK
jgi:hypothetical protein